MPLDFVPTLLKFLEHLYRLIAAASTDMLRQAVARGVLAQLEGCSSGITSSSSLCALAQQLQQTVGFAKKTESVDGRLQRVLKALEPQEVETVQVSEEDYLEGMRRCVKEVAAVAAACFLCRHS